MLAGARSWRPCGGGAIIAAICGKTRFFDRPAWLADSSLESNFQVAARSIANRNLSPDSDFEGSGGGKK